MNLLHKLGLDTNEVYGGVLIFIGIAAFIFAYVHWKRNTSWKYDKDHIVKFTDIWKPSVIFGCVLFLLLGTMFFFINPLIDALKQAAPMDPLPFESGTVTETQQIPEENILKFSQKVPYTNEKDGSSEEIGYADITVSYPEGLFPAEAEFSDLFSCLVFQSADGSGTDEEWFDSLYRKNHPETASYESFPIQISGNSLVRTMTRFSPEDKGTLIYSVSMHAGFRSILCLDLSSLAAADRNTDVFDDIVRSVRYTVSISSLS